MIQITRALARQVRAVFRKAVPLSSGRSHRLPLSLHADKDGLRIRSHHAEVAVEFHLAGSRPTDVITLPAEALDHCEGRKDDAVILANTEPSTAQVRWDDGGVPQIRDYTAPDLERLPRFPEVPKKLFPIDPGILKALDDATQTAAKEGVRFAVQKVQLRGSTGDIIATDGRQLLVQGGFSLPWGKEDLLVPATSVFACRELPQDAEVSIGKTDKHVCVRVGPWTFYLTIDKDARFPNVQSVIPAATASATVCRLSTEDAEFLGKTLPRLPGREEENAPLTLDLNGHVAIRAKGEQSRPTEVVLSHSEVIGPPVRFVSNREHLARAVALGCTEFRVVKADVPIVGTNGLKTFLWMPLAKDGAIPPSDDALRITSTATEAAIQSAKKERSSDIMPMNKTSPNGQSNGHAPQRGDDNGHAQNGNGPGLNALITEAQALKELLHGAYGRSARLISALKRQRKQSKLLQGTLASLRQLQQLPLDG